MSALDRRMQYVDYQSIGLNAATAVQTFACAVTVTQVRHTIEQWHSSYYRHSALLSCPLRALCRFLLHQLDPPTLCLFHNNTRQGLCGYASTAEHTQCTIMHTDSSSSTA
jgi:hypothetical protein